ncbi:hypothetical protein CAOG_05150 [Capsaspora owczarzaki ATCC 30864]|uniref:Mannose-P-dolichol utilization defect 1 protein homolog n=1 Tax=Capsaspora owczarzaki (strain ATCC 30864) TaxID=595528 RepID=A0A0D2VTE6_CAPO3|nr:hypothetical protein CAOG_05150 [Capsaspora owczarzaki ATCC 30864]KJE94517.1 hypothetical protein CAOG_005150 [Capsaspora owczarzaki ATCC 30864]|eukprot:XP_004346835.2 hypothetical protein CAOG_05150 [Capsaspora owczarzaki ATCC 30864]
METVTQSLVTLLGEHCFDELVVKQNIANFDCLSHLLAKMLGYVIILGAVFVKIPQILKIVKAGNAEGISMISNVLELAGYITTFGYNAVLNYPFSTWGEYLFLTIQSFVLLLLLVHFSKAYVLGGLAILFEVALAYSIFSGLVSGDHLKFMLLATIPVFAVSKIPQILTNFRNGHTGQLSAVTLSMNLGGSLGRVFTTLKQVSDPIVLASSFFNSVLVLQLALYWGKKPAAAAAAKSTETKKNK